MSNVVIVTDSNSGITQSAAKELGVHVLPMPFMIDGETFYEDLNLTQEEFYAWSEKAREKKAECESGKTTLEEFGRWLGES